MHQSTADPANLPRPPASNPSFIFALTAAMPELTPDFPTPSLLRRMACWLYEGVLLFGVVMLAGLAFGIATNTRNALEHRHGLQTAVFLVLALYFVYSWHRGQTLPMKTWRIRITDRNGQPVSWLRAAWRYLLAWLWFLPPLAVMAPYDLRTGQVAVLVLGWVAVWALLSRFHPQRQFLHDALAGTRLVAASPDPRKSPPA